jgi:hypothetical protein
MTCNIDAKGKLVRLIYGIGLLLPGIALLLLWTTSAKTLVSWIIPLGPILGGAFAIFEALTGWCVLRAMGFKTPI